jgi:soluble lytic murein transglycosylase-like protein
MVFACGLSATAAHAMERVMLRSGFSMDCAHHAMVGQKIRLYLTADDANYEDIAAAQIASIETVPDPPKPVVKDVAAVKPVAAATDTKPSAAELQQMMASAGEAHDIDVELLASVIKVESGFRVNAVSRVGARGLMQLMPGTARELGVKDITRADENIDGGTAYLDSLLKLYKNDLRLALAAYNAGPAAVARYHGVPPYRETQAYVNRVIREFNRRMAARTTAHAAAMIVASR